MTVQRLVELVGIPTVGITVALDETRQANPPRALHVEGAKPGQSLARPDPVVQRQILLDAFELLDRAREPGTIRSVRY